MNTKVRSFLKSKDVIRSLKALHKETLESIEMMGDCDHDVGLCICSVWDNADTARSLIEYLETGKTVSYYQNKIHVVERGD